MGFGFFKKKGNGKKERDKDLFDPTHDALDFDELEESGEFLSGDNFESPPAAPDYPPPPAPAYPPQPSVPPRPAPRAAPLPPAPPRPSTPPPPSPPAAPVYDDLTVVNLPPHAPTTSTPQHPAAPPGAAPPGPAPPAPPQRPAPAAPPAPPGPPLSQPPSPSAGQQPRVPYVGDDDVTQILSAPVGMESVVAWLVVASGSCRGRDFRLPGGMARIGLDLNSDICLDFDSFVSGRHAEISFRDGQYQIRDLDSTNGSFINETRISEAVLRDNDRLRLGQTTFVFKSLKL